MLFSQVRTRLAGLAIGLSLLTGCGGGGGSGGASAPSVKADTTSLSTSGPVTSDSIPNLTINLTATNTPSSGLYVAGTTTNNGVSTLSPGNFTASTGQIQVFLKAPNTLAPGTYKDSVTVQVCTDKACASQVAGSPISVSVTYTVTAVTGSGAPTLSVTPGVVSVHLLPTDPAPPAGAYYVGASVANAPSYGLTVKFTATTNGLQPTATLTLSQDPNGIQAGDANLTFKAPAALAPGLYTDTLTISVCLDPACVNPIAGSPAAITVSYLIGNSLPGASGDTVIQLPMHANALVWDSVRSVIYASIAADSPTSPNSIVIINPAAGIVTSTVMLAGEAGHLAISDDGAYLYAAARNTNTVWRLALPNLAVDATLNLGAGFYAFDLAVAPGIPTTLGISRSTSPPGPVETSLNSAGVVVFDGTTARPDIAGYGAQGATAELDYLAWGPTASTLYADDSWTSGQALTTLSVAAAGPQVSASLSGITSGRIHQVSGLIYTDAGVVFDPVAGKITGTLPFPSGLTYGSLAVGLDAAVPRVYSLSLNGPNTALYIFDQKSLALLRAQAVLGTTVSVYSENPTPLIRWGANGIAYASYDGQIILISGAYLTN
jgi:hypothetical protein